MVKNSAKILAGTLRLVQCSFVHRCSLENSLSLRSFETLYGVTMEIDTEKNITDENLSSKAKPKRKNRAISKEEKENEFENDAEGRETKEDANDRNVKKSKTKPKFIYGNYQAYYGYRVGKGEQDDRMKILRKKWFFGKDCLDVGCNIGRLTMDIAKTFDPSTITGIDIDSLLIARAKDILKQKRQQKPMDFPKSFALTMGPLKHRPFPHNVDFTCANFLEYQDSKVYDTVICLSTTKWIHLNWGDEGIKKLFQKVRNGLKEGGLFVLEPQEWKSYKKKASLTETTKKNFKSIQLKPDMFDKYLTEELDFERLESLDVPSSMSKSEGFERPIYLYRRKYVQKDVEQMEQ